MEPIEISSSVTPAELAELCRLAAGGRILEVGSWHGRSTIELARVAREVHAVDWHRGDSHVGEGDSLPIFLENLTRYDAWASVVPHIAKFDRVAPVLAQRSFDGAFIDAFHTYDAVLADFRLALPLIRPGGWIAFHDYGLPQFGVTQAVDEIAEFFELRVVETLAVIEDAGRG